MASSLLAMASNLITAMASNLLVMADGLQHPYPTNHGFGGGTYQNVSYNFRGVPSPELIVS